MPPPKIRSMFSFLALYDGGRGGTGEGGKRGDGGGGWGTEEEGGRGRGMGDGGRGGTEEGLGDGGRGGVRGWTKILNFPLPVPFGSASGLSFSGSRLFALLTFQSNKRTSVKIEPVTRTVQTP